MLNDTISSRVTQLLDVVLPATMSTACISVLVYMVGSAAGLMA